jgi:hypothetical protein
VPLGRTGRDCSYDAGCRAALAILRQQSPAVDWFYESISSRRNRGGRSKSPVKKFGEKVL